MFFAVVIFYSVSSFQLFFRLIVLILILFFFLSFLYDFFLLFIFHNAGFTAVCSLSSLDDLFFCPYGINYPLTVYRSPLRLITEALAVFFLQLLAVVFSPPRLIALHPLSRIIRPYDTRVVSPNIQLRSA